MKAYEIMLPLKDNSGKDLNRVHGTFQKLALAIARGYTKRPSVEGAYEDTKTGMVYYDRLIPYLFACDRATFEQVKLLAFNLFPDQIALYWHEVEGVVIERRPAARQPDRARVLRSGANAN